MKLLPNHSPQVSRHRVVSGRCRANDPSRIAMMMASGDEMRGEQGDALATVSKSVVETLEEIEETRQNICRLVWREKKAPNTISKDRPTDWRNVTHVQPVHERSP